MAVSKSKIIANKKYRAKTYDTIGFDVPKGKREEFKAKATELGLSLAKFLFVAAESYGEGCEVMTAQKLKPEISLTLEQKKFLDEFNQLPADGQRLLVKFLQSVNRSVNPGTEFVADQNPQENGS